MYVDPHAVPDVARILIAPERFTARSGGGFEPHMKNRLATLAIVTGNVPAVVVEPLECCDAIVQFLLSCASAHRGDPFRLGCANYLVDQMSMLVSGSNRGPT